MANEIVFNELDFEENIWDFFTFMMYKGKPFTGTIVEGNWTIEFKDGNANGKSVEYYDNGQIASDEVYENGHYVSGKEWYANGQIKYDSIGKEWYETGQPKKDNTGIDSLWWDADGKLAKINDSWLYKNGQKRNETDVNGNRLTFASNGDLAIKQVLNKEDSSITYFYDGILTQYYDELLTNLYPELNFSEGASYICGWVDKIYHHNINRGKAIIQKLTEHNNVNTRKHANYLKKLAIKKESGSKERTYWLDNDPKHIIIF